GDPAHLGARGRADLPAARELAAAAGRAGPDTVVRLFGPPGACLRLRRHGHDADDLAAGVRRAAQKCAWRTAARLAGADCPVPGDRCAAVLVEHTEAARRRLAAAAGGHRPADADGDLEAGAPAGARYAGGGPAAARQLHGIAGSL